MKKALITGASSGIGRELALLLSQKGYELILFGRNEKALKDLVEQLTTRAEIVLADLVEESGRELLLKTIRSHVPDLVINNAGFGFYGDIGPQEAQDTIQINCTALVQSTLAAIDALKMKKKGGVICNISSALAFFPTPGMSVYGASKAFVNSFSIAQDFENRPFGICVIAPCPGQVATNFRLRASKGKSPEPSHSPLVMSAQFVASEIYNQIIMQKPVCIIDWKTRLLVFLAKLLPARFVMGRLLSEIHKRH